VSREAHLQRARVRATRVALDDILHRLASNSVLIVQLVRPVHAPEALAALRVHRVCMRRLQQVLLVSGVLRASILWAPMELAVAVLLAAFRLLLQAPVHYALLVLSSPMTELRHVILACWAATPIFLAPLLVTFADLVSSPISLVLLLVRNALRGRTAPLILQPTVEALQSASFVL